MALQHEFGLFKSIDEVIFNSDTRKKMKKLDDAFILTSLDSTNWIPSFSRNFEKKTMGLDYYGETYLKDNGIKVFKEIVAGWIKIFEQAPFIFELTTGYDLEEGTFFKTKVEKASILKQLQGVYELCQQALDNDAIIVHFGI